MVAMIRADLHVGLQPMHRQVDSEGLQHRSVATAECLSQVDHIQNVVLPLLLVKASFFCSPALVSVLFHECFACFRGGTPSDLGKCDGMDLARPSAHGKAQQSTCTELKHGISVAVPIMHTDQFTPAYACAAT